MAQIKVERTLGPAKRAVFKGLQAFNEQALGTWDFKPAFRLVGSMLVFTRARLPTIASDVPGPGTGAATSLSRMARPPVSVNVVLTP